MKWHFWGEPPHRIYPTHPRALNQAASTKRNGAIFEQSSKAKNTFIREHFRFRDFRPKVTVQSHGRTKLKFNVSAVSIFLKKISVTHTAFSKIVFPCQVAEKGGISGKKSKSKIFTITYFLLLSESWPISYFRLAKNFSLAPLIGWTPLAYDHIISGLF